jgi:hypothetical protein
VIDVADIDAAEAWAARVPSATYGSVEVRPVLTVPAVEPAWDRHAVASA